MLFNSVAFLIFFPVVTLLFFVLPHRVRWAHLLLASGIFYASFVPIYLLILAFTIGVDYVAGIMIERSEGSRRKLFLVASIVANVGVLCVFKYWNFLNRNLTVALGWAGLRNHLPLLALALPIGLSFHTFQAMSYTIEVYRRRQPAERHLGIYALYVMFYPQLVAGPIERPQQILFQFRERKSFEATRVAAGLKVMAWGFFKKLVISDNLALVVTPVFNLPRAYSGAAQAMATLCFAARIYCDFSGYSDIALGSAQVMGFTLMRNFDCPYESTSLTEFWRRWHISLSSWFKDYLYIPLGGNRRGPLRNTVNKLVVFTVSGLWHGANWTFLVWGALHGVYLVIEQAVKHLWTTLRGRERSPGPLSRASAWAVTFVLVCLAWIFFRANNVSDGWFMVRSILTMSRGAAPRLGLGALDHRVTYLALFLVVLAAEAYDRRRGLFARIERLSAPLRYVFYAGLVYGTILFHGADTQFIYFQF